jgi:hypothetical protein
VKGIGLREASAKYQIPRSTLSDWVAAGLVRKLQEPARRGQATLLYERDVEDLAKNYQPGRHPGRGKKLSLETRTIA